MKQLFRSKSNNLIKEQRQEIHNLKEAINKKEEMKSSTSNNS
jgi:hypothetical protein